MTLEEFQEWKGSYEVAFRESEPLHDGHCDAIFRFLESEPGKALIGHLWRQSQALGMVLVRPIEDLQSVLLPDAKGQAPAAPWTPLRHNFRAGMVTGVNRTIDLIVSAVVEQQKPVENENG